MIRHIVVLVALLTFGVSAASADLPTYPGAKPFGTAQGQPGANIKVDMPGMPGMNAMNSSSKSHTYTLPATTSFDEIKKFYSAELKKLGFVESANVNITGMAMPTQTVSFSSNNGMNTVTITLTKNVANATENLLSVSESSTSLH